MHPAGVLWFEDLVIGRWIWHEGGEEPEGKSRIREVGDLGAWTSCGQ